MYLMPPTPAAPSPGADDTNESLSMEAFRRRLQNSKDFVEQELEVLKNDPATQRVIEDFMTTGEVVHLDLSRRLHTRLMQIIDRSPNIYRHSPNPVRQLILSYIHAGLVRDGYTPKDFV